MRMLAPLGPPSAVFMPNLASVYTRELAHLVLTSKLQSSSAWIDRPEPQREKPSSTLRFQYQDLCLTSRALEIFDQVCRAKHP